MPGIEIGDIGHKIGYQSVDNGYLALKNVRIPRDNLMQRFFGLSKEGEVSILGNPKMIY